MFLLPFFSICAPIIAIAAPLPTISSAHLNSSPSAAAVFPSALQSLPPAAAVSPFALSSSPSATTVSPFALQFSPSSAAVFPSALQSSPSAAAVSPSVVASSPKAEKSSRCTVGYEPSDSVEIERLLGNAALRSPLDFARQLLNRPYRASTLEGYDPERIVVNFRAFDCATFVESVLALVRCRRFGEYAFSDFVRRLEEIRYFDGRNSGYLSRLHYLSFWIADHKRRATIAEVEFPKRVSVEQRVRLRYMSSHPEQYQSLSAHPEWVKNIAALEAQHSGIVGRFVPKALLASTSEALRTIRNGDLVCIVTRKSGLDFSHQGFAFWSADGRLHLLHASSEQGRVVEDRRSLSDYLHRLPHVLGVRVFRLS